MTHQRRREDSGRLVVGARAREHGIDGWSLNAWRMNLARRKGTAEPPRRRLSASSSRTGLVELAAATLTPSPSGRYVSAVASPMRSFHVIVPPEYRRVGCLPAEEFVDQLMAEIGELGTKLRALFQRKKGRNLFDLWYALELGVVDPGALLRCFVRCMTEGGHAVTRAQFDANLHEKATDGDFRADIEPLLRPGIGWDFDVAFAVVNQHLIEAPPGDPWKGLGER